MKKFSWRRYISIGLALSFILILLSGVVLYIAPKGSIARWTQWGFLGLERAQWETQHTIFSYLFAAFGLVHLFYLNWKAFLSYLRRKIVRKEKRKVELYYAMATILLIFILTHLEVRPVYSVMELGNRISSSWEERIGRPPVSGVEDLTIDKLASDYFKTDTEEILDQLKAAGYSARNSEQSLREIASDNDVGIMVIFNSIDLKAKP